MNLSKANCKWQLSAKQIKEDKKLVYDAHRYKSSELFVFRHFKLDILVAGFLLQAVLCVRLEYLVKLSDCTQSNIYTKTLICLTGYTHYRNHYHYYHYYYSFNATLIITFTST